MFRNTKKVNIVQEHQKIKSFSLQELTKQNKGRTKDTQCKMKKCLKEEKTKTKNENKRERKERGLNQFQRFVFFKKKEQKKKEVTSTNAVLAAMF